MSTFAAQGIVQKIEPLLVVVGQVITVLSGVLVLSITSNRISTDLFALYVILLTAIAGVSQVGFGGLNAASGRFFSIAENDGSRLHYFSKINQIARTQIIKVGVLASISLAIFGVLSDRLSAIAIFFVLSSACVSAYRNNLSRIQNAARQRFSFASYQFLEATIKIVSLDLFLPAANALEIIFLINLVAGTITAVLQQAQLNRTLHNVGDVSHSSESYKASVIEFMRPFYIWTFFVWVFQSSGRWALDIFSSPLDVAGFAIIYQLVFSPISIIFTMTSIYLSPIIYRDYDVGDSRSDSVLKFIVYASFITLTALSILSFSWGDGLRNILDFYFSFLVPSEYLFLTDYFLSVFFAAFFSGASEIFLLRMQAQMRVSAIRNIRCFSSIFGLVAIVIGAHLADLQGVIFGFLVSQLINFLAFSVVMKYGR